MDTIELKFLLKLLGETDYRALLSKIQPNNQTKASDRERICRKLCDRGWVDCDYEITKLKIAPPGKALLKLDPLGLPVSEQELKVLRASEKLTGLSAFRERGFARWVLGERLIFIRHLRATYPAGIYNAKEFFGALYDLTNPELYPIACDWLRGDDLDEGDRKQLGVKHAVDNEDAVPITRLTNATDKSSQVLPIVTSDRI